MICERTVYGCVYVSAKVFGKHIHIHIWNTLLHLKFGRFLLDLGNSGHMIFRTVAIGSLVMHNEDSLCFRFGDRLRVGFDHGAVGSKESGDDFFFHQFSITEILVT